MKQLSKRAKTVWIIRNVLWAVVLSVIAVVTLVMISELSAFPVLAAVMGVLYAVPVVLLLVFPALSYRYYTYGCDDKRIVIRRGVVFRHAFTIPLCQVQDLHVEQGPVKRLFGLADVTLATGGSNFDISALDQAVAEQLVEDVEARLRERIEGASHEEV